MEHYGNEELLMNHSLKWIWVMRVERPLQDESFC